jgi:hypothetical protein
VRVAAVVADLMTYSRIEGAAAAAGAIATRVDDPADLPGEPLDLLLVDWSARTDAWASRLVQRRDARVILFGPHTDLAAHAAARAAGLGPMWARSKLVATLPLILAGEG